MTRSPQAEHLRYLAQELRAAGDVPLVNIGEDGVGEADITLADALWLTAVELDGHFELEGAGALDPTEGDE